MAKPTQSTVSTPKTIKITFEVWLIETPDRSSGPPTIDDRELAEHPLNRAAFPRVGDTARRADRAGRDLPAPTGHSCVEGDRCRGEQR